MTSGLLPVLSLCGRKMGGRAQTILYRRNANLLALLPFVGLIVLLYLTGCKKDLTSRKQ